MTSETTNENTNESTSDSTPNETLMNVAETVGTTLGKAVAATNRTVAAARTEEKIVRRKAKRTVKRPKKQ